MQLMCVKTRTVVISNNIEQYCEFIAAQSLNGDKNLDSLSCIHLSIEI